MVEMYITVIKRFKTPFTIFARLTKNSAPQSKCGNIEYPSLPDSAQADPVYIVDRRLYSSIPDGRIFHKPRSISGRGFQLAR